jgi:6-phosphogluconolactonase
MKTTIIAVLLSLASSAPVLATTFVYVSNAEDGEIGMYTLRADGSLEPGQRFKAANLVMPMVVSPDKRFLIAAVRSKPYQAYSYNIDRGSGALNFVGSGTLAESYPYISLDRSGRFLFGASYGANQLGVNPVGADGKVGEPLQVVPMGRNPHAIRTDNANRFVFVPHLGTDQVFQFTFDEKSGRLTANTPPLVQLKPGTGPRHLIVSPDNRFVYLLNELTGTVTTLSLDPARGTLKELASVSALPPDTKLAPGMPRGAVGTPGANEAPRNTDNDIWASDLHLTPNGRFLYAAHLKHSRRVPSRCFERDTHLHRKHADREAAPGVRCRSIGSLCGGVRREVGHDIVVRDRRGDRRAQADRPLCDRERRELGRDRRIRIGR